MMRRLLLVGTLLGFTPGCSATPAPTAPVVAVQDPAYAWAQPVTGRLAVTHGITVRSDGSAVVVGSARAGQPLGVGASALNLHGGGTDLFVASLDPQGNVQWAGSFGGSGEDYAFDTVNDMLGNVLVVGQVSGRFDFAGVLVDTEAAISDALVAKFDVAGGLLWLLTGTGPGKAYGNEVAVGPDGSAAVVGVYTDRVTFGFHTLTAPAGVDAWQVFVARVSADGAPLWARSVNGTGTLGGRAVGVGAGGRVLLGAEFSGTISVQGGADGTRYHTAAGGTDCLVAAYVPDGSLLWSRAFGGPGDDKCRGIGGDASGGVWVAGTFTGTVTFGEITLTGAGGTDLFTLQLDADGTPRRAFALGSAGDDEGAEIEVGPGGTLTLAAQLAGSVALPGGTTFTPAGGARDLIVAHFEPHGALSWIVGSPGSGDDVNYALAVTPDGDVLSAGTFMGDLRFDTDPPTVLSGPASYVAWLDATPRRNP